MYATPYPVRGFTEAPHALVKHFQSWNAAWDCWFENLDQFEERNLYRKPWVIAYKSTSALPRGITARDLWNAARGWREENVMTQAFALAVIGAHVGTVSGVPHGYVMFTVQGKREAMYLADEFEGFSVCEHELVFEEGPVKTD